MQQGCVFSPDLIHLYKEMILRGLENLSEFIIGRCNRKTILSADDTVDGIFRKETERIIRQTNRGKPEERTNSNCKKTDAQLSAKETTQGIRNVLWVVKIKQVKKFNYLGSVVSGNGKCLVF